jgi:lipoyl(octanoyl) transferase
MNECFFTDLGKMDYKEAWDYQLQLFNDKILQKSENVKPIHDLLFVEHPHVYTFGKSAEKQNLLVSPAMLNHLGASVYEIERGGDITYHGPGQLVAYPIFDLESLNIGVKKFVANIELAIINTLKTFGIESEVIPDRIGVWIEKGGKRERKIAAIGIKCSKYVTMHGLALNVSTDLTMFQQIVPCGILDKEVTSIEKELNGKIDMNDVKNELGNQFASIFGLKLTKK